MMSGTNSISAAQLAEQAFEDAMHAIEREVGADELLIWGGEFAAGEESNRLAKFLQVWHSHFNDDGLRWMMLEEVSQFVLNKSRAHSLIERADKVERARLFGPAGDLDVRRDGNMMYWRFLGEPTGASWPDLTTFEGGQANFWAEQPDTRFAVVDEEYYQWLANERRVAVAGQQWYEVDHLSEDNVYLCQRHYMENGRLAFARFLDIKEIKSNG